MDYKKLLYLLIIPLFFACVGDKKKSEETIITNESASISEKNNITLEGPFYDYYKALDYAKKVNKPILISFSGMACFNSRIMEEEIFLTKEVNSLLNNVIECYLFVDSKNKLENPDTIYITNKHGKMPKKIIKTTGQKWVQLQIEQYQTNTVPYYILYSWQDGPILEPIAYTPNYKAFAKWLENGINDFYNK